MRRASGDLDDTIAALATAPGRAALAVVRLSGKDSRTLLEALAPGLPEALEPRHAYRVDLVDRDGNAIDQAIATFFAAPHSYTGEDAAEISVHGSPRVVERLLAVLTRAGARLARPGEFTERALLSGRMDLVEAEAVRELIEARTERAAAISARRLAGALSARLTSVRERLLGAATSLTATIDFAEDVGEAVDPSVLASLGKAGEELARLAASYRTGRLLASGCRVAILGRPNAGKSTLFNALVGSARAIVTEFPGTTRDALDATLDVGGVPVTVVDTAGLRETADPVEAIGVARALEEAEKADAILYVSEAGVSLEAGEKAALADLGDKDILFIINKIDAAPAGWQPPPEAVVVCGLAPEAAEVLQAAIERHLTPSISLEASDEVIGNLRQRDLVERASRAASDARDALCRGDSPEYAASHVDAALSALADVFGETTSEDVLERIFSTFCIGK